MLSSNHIFREIIIDFKFNLPSLVINYDYNKVHRKNFKKQLNINSILNFNMEISLTQEKHTEFIKALNQAIKDNIPTKERKCNTLGFSFYLRTLIEIQNVHGKIRQRKPSPLHKLMLKVFLKTGL